MLKKHFVLFLSSILFAGISFAQLKAGNWLLEGNSNFSFQSSKIKGGGSEDKATILSLNISSGYLIQSNIETGITLTYENIKEEEESYYDDYEIDISSYLLGVYGRFHFMPKESFDPWAKLAFYFVGVSNGASITGNGFELSFGFLSQMQKSIYLSGSIYYRKISWEHDIDENTTGAGFGIVIKF